MARRKLAAWAAAFAGTVVLDGVWAAYIRALAVSSHTAVLWSAATILVGGAVVRLYTKDGWLLVPAALGAGVGTALIQAYG